ncbi:MAG: glycosyl hydrolase 115 family protein [Calditrichaceae bacterium]|nr:glycosyl hydrolase 115 family protein [Calditrichaceae bacterium]
MGNPFPLYRKGIIYVIIIFLALFTFSISIVSASESYISSEDGPGYFPLLDKGKSATLFLSSQDYPGVLKVAAHLQTDINRVSGTMPELIMDKIPKENALVIIGTIGKSPVIDQLIKEQKIDADKIINRWDTYALQTVDEPLPGISQALVIFGANKRGTIYGMYDLSAQIGVSPWHWWADVPAKQRKTIYVKPGFYSPGEPKVKYRGILINDEAPALTNWAKETFGGFNHKFYEKVFELILRNKGNYLWPAMWPPSAFWADDPENARLADELGVVMATSHHEPLMRSHAEWNRERDGEWNYETNKETLQKFWRGGMERMGNYESVVTVGMRGDGDEAMSENTAVDLLKTIIADQRKIIADVTGKPAEETPQVWAIYKEVQDYYDKGMRVPDDITVLLCDDNWGNIRILPKKEDLKRKGGFGIYYHFDFVGGPVSYRWLNVTQIERVWEQMNLAYQWGVKQIWLVNVGDIKPMELPISFFLDFAWNPEAIKAGDLPQYYIDWAEQQFGNDHAKEIAEILSLYTKYNARRTPEMLKPDTYSLINYREADTIVDDYKKLAEKSKKIYDALPESHRAAFYQLVHFPVEICSNINEMYVAAGKNNFYGIQGRASANYYAEKVKELFINDAELTRYYHEELAGGKWNHMMSQTHIGYTYWNNPPVNKMPAVSWVHTPTPAGLGYVIENNQNFFNR